MKRNWWHEAVVYQIYPRSFKDSNADGIGDIPGIIEKLDYLSELGINTVWLCPVCASPMIDNGYDISDYRGINPEFGTIADMERLIEEAGKKDIRILLDLVLNHSSNEHPWFKRAVEALLSNDMQNPCLNYYYFRNGRDGEAPNNWRSYFGGSAWERIETTDYWYLHLFAKEQPDLNWENPGLRRELYGMIHWWMDKGIAGFRIDAICNIKKDLTFADLPVDGPDGLAAPLPSCLAFPGIEVFLSEMRDEVFKKRNAFTVAEAAGVKPEMLPLFIGKDGFFSVIFDFSYTDIDIVPGSSCNKRYFFTHKELRDRIFASQLALQKYGCGAPYLENHDQNRSPDKYLPSAGRNFEGKTMLGMLYFFLQGVPFIYQGQELGMTNYPWENMDEFNDISTHDQYKRMIQAGLSGGEALAFAAYRSRDNARTPMFWDRTENAGFSTVKPWLPVHPDYRFLNVKVQEESTVSVLNFYKKMIQLRKKHWRLFVYGKFIPRPLGGKNIIAYERSYRNKRVLIVCNFSDKPEKTTLSAGTIWLGNYRPAGMNIGDQYTLAPMEACLVGIKI